MPGNRCPRCQPHPTARWIHSSLVSVVLTHSCGQTPEPQDLDLWQPPLRGVPPEKLPNIDYSRPEPGQVKPRAKKPRPAAPTVDFVRRSTRPNTTH